MAFDRPRCETSTIEGFVIENFTGHGVLIQTVGKDEVINDCIGTNAAHDGAALGHTLDGVKINNVANNAIQNCIISGNDQHGIEITGAAALNNLVGTGLTANPNVGLGTAGGNYIGVDYDASGPIANGMDGVIVHGGAGMTTINDNVISGNTQNGIELNASSQNTITGNFIGVTGDATAKLPNTLDGILLTNAGNNTIGGTSAGTGNVISGNLHNGIDLAGTGTTNTNILGNFIGTDGTGAKAIANQMDGILINGAPSNHIGQSTAGATNYISGNTKNGVHISGTASTGNKIEFNFIGTNKTGDSDVANIGDGVLIDTGATGNLVGGTTQGFRNVISGNDLSGVEINGKTTTGNNVQNDYIGTSADGTMAVGNLGDGVTLTSAASNTIGGTVPPLGCVISGNGDNGIDITGSDAMGNKVYGNKLGTNADGNEDLGNGNDGVLIEQSASNNNIGTSGTADAINVISGNDQNGIELNGSGTTGNKVQNCYIGTDVSGVNAVENGNDGVYLLGAPGNFIGGTNEQTFKLVQGNLISGNASDGVEINGSSATNNHIQGNFIGATYTSSSALPNGGEGVDIISAPGNVIGSAAGESADYRNAISGNTGNGVRISGDAAAGNTLGGNFIGTDITGAQAVPNTADGVLILGAPNTTIASTNTSPNALVSGNGSNGIEISGAGATGTKILTVLIGTDATGNGAIGNTGEGILIDGGSTTTVRTGWSRAMI